MGYKFRAPSEKGDPDPHEVRDVPDGEPFVQLDGEWIEYVVGLRLSKHAFKVLFCLLAEHCSNADKANGYLIVTYDEFESHGIPRKAIKAALDELVEAGLLIIECAGRGFGGNGNPSLYRLTFLSSEDIQSGGTPYYVKRLINKDRMADPYQQLRKRYPEAVDRLREVETICHICGQPFKDGERKYIEHVIPLSCGGPNDPSNLAVAHLSCNSKKGRGLFNPITGQGWLL